jgi:uncharacterized protein YprB with RNaseH-like and TPR domain
MNELRCIHRHGQDTHPRCFDKNGLPINKAVSWYDGLRIGYLDIESDGLKSDFSTMLSYCIKERGGAIYSNVITKEELFNGVTDSRLVQDLINEMNGFDILVTYYGTGFDIPYIRSKAMHYGYDFPGYEKVVQFNGNTAKTVLIPSIYHWDLYYVVKSKMNLSRKSLDNACQYLGIKGKTPLDKDSWRLAKYGDEKALKGVLEHNEGDVVILEELHDCLWNLGKWERKPL